MERENIVDLQKRFAIGLDVGGTSLKSAVVVSNGSILKNSFRRTPIKSKGSADSIIETFVQTLNSHLKMVDRLKIEGIGIGIPGPFDYEEGISLIPLELHKYNAIHGLNLKQELMERLGIRKIRFENDAWVFLRGEAWMGAAKGYNRIIGLTLGTGLGSAFMVGDQMLTKGAGVPPLGWIGGMSYENGMVEDKIARRWIIVRYKELSGEKNDLSVEEIAMRGKQGDEASIKTFEEIGQKLGQTLKPIVSKFKAECIVFGGQISKSFSLFSDPIKRELQSVSTLKKITPAYSIDLSPIYGAAKLAFLGPLYKPTKLTF